MQARGKETEKGWGGAGWGLKLLQWLAPSVEIKGRKVLGQAEAWPRCWEMVRRENLQWQVSAGRAQMHTHKFKFSCNYSSLDPVPTSAKLSHQIISPFYYC